MKFSRQHASGAIGLARLAVAALFALATGEGRAQVLEQRQKPAVRVTDSIHQAPGFGNTYLVTTREGNVVIDTSSKKGAEAHKRLLTAISDAPVRSIILTHAHEDHRGGVSAWKGPDTEVIAHRRFDELVDYQRLLGGFFGVRNRAQFGGGVGDAIAGGKAERSPSDVTTRFEDRHSFDLGGLTFELHSTPGETYDAISAWIPQEKAAFLGDNFYDSFPNIYTLRGTTPRWATDYIRSLDKVLSWEPEILLPGHGEPIRGRDEIRRRLTRYRDAIQFVHDATVRGMNEGKDVFSLMKEIKLPPELEIETSYGNLPWSIRGIYEGYAGWFDANPSNMYSEPPRAIYGDLAEIAGPGPILKRGEARLDAGEAVLALHLADVVLESDPSHAKALDLRIRALEHLLAASKNSNERGWLQYGLRQARERLGKR